MGQELDRYTRRQDGTTAGGIDTELFFRQYRTGPLQELNRYMRQEGQDPCRIWIDTLDRKDRTLQGAG
jgi:hypothetical protein